jgi:hypothetical protein
MACPDAYLNHDSDDHHHQKVCEYLISDDFDVD